MRRARANYSVEFVRSDNEVLVSAETDRSPMRQDFAIAPSGDTGFPVEKCLIFGHPPGAARL